MYIPDVTENAKYFQQPYNDCDDYNNIEDVFDFTIHRYIIIDKPKKQTGNNQYD